MDNQGEDFPGGPPPERNNVRGGSGLPNNIFSSSLRSIDPQYAAALDFEELRIRQQLEVQQDIELRRRLMEEQQHQLISELEYRNQMQQLQELQELQVQQQQQQDLSQLLAQNPQLLELHQQQQYHSGHENSLLSSLHDDFLLRRHQLALQDHMQHQLQEQISQEQLSRDSQHQQIQEQLSRDSHRHQLHDQLSRNSQQHEQEDFLAMLQASGNLRGVLPTDISSLRHEETILQQPQPPGVASPVQVKAPPPEPAPLQLEEQLPNNSSNQTGDSTLTNHGLAYSQNDASSANKRINRAESLDLLYKNSPEDQPMVPKKEPAKTSPPINPHCPKDAKSEEEEVLENRPAKNKELDGKVAELLQSQKLSAIKLPTKKKKDKGNSEKKRKKKEDKGKPPVKNRGKKKKTPTTLQAGKMTWKKEGHGDDVEQLFDQEQSVIDFLGSRGSKNEEMSTSETNGTDQTCTKKQCEEAVEAKDHFDGKALEILFDFKRTKVSADEVQNIKKWSTENQTLAVAISPSVLPKEHHLPSPGLKFSNRSLPTKPLVNDLELPDRRSLANNNPTDMGNSDMGKEMCAVVAPTESSGLMGNGKAGLFVSNKKRALEHKKVEKAQDEWWPSNAATRKERLKCGQDQDVEDSDKEAYTTVDSIPGIKFVKAGVRAAKQRLATSVEPGVLEKLPYCKLYNDYCKEHKTRDFAPKFCCQTTETFPFEVMVCCSICSTWRHAQCGGHYKRYTPDSVDPSNVLFQAVCDRCFLEKHFFNDKDVAAARIERQRIEHVRRGNASNAVMRQFAFGKHSGQYKWPLGSVHISRIPGHIRSVQTRHEKVEKQWNEMTHRLTNRQELRPRERQRVRTREFERLLVSIEDAERAMDRHNMMLFLQNDTSKLHPAGFEIPRRNIFDPEEDPDEESDEDLDEDPGKDQLNGPGQKSDLAGPSESLDNMHLDINYKSKAESVSSSADTTKEKGTRSDVKELNTNSIDQNIGKHLDNGANKVASQSMKHPTCSRQGCNKKSRFDSIFCSDSCGVSTLETDLLRTLQYADKLHPSLLRP